MRKVVLLLASVALVALLSLGASGSMAREAWGLPARPNFVFILTDDMRKDDLQYMPKTRSRLQHRGMTFSNAFVSNAVCCPSRATIMRGQYAHNTGVWTNDATNSPNGGWQAYRDNGLEQDNVATRLDAAGYRTGLFGKYLNDYDDSTGVPPGWDRWFALTGLRSNKYFGYDVNDDGTLRHFGTRDRDYQTDVLKRQAKAFVGASVNQGEPFFAYVAPYAPHQPATPAPRDLHTYDGVNAPRPPSFDEADVSDKPPWIRQLPQLSTDVVTEIDARHEARAESLQAADDLVAGVLSELKSTGVMDNTYVIFTSDNGWHEGEHRIPRYKWRPYEEDVRMPLLVRGPGVAAGHDAQELALNTDFLPTFTDLACPSSAPCDTQNWTYVPDGRSLRPVLEGNASAWRNSVLLEAVEDSSPAYYGIRTGGGRKYVEYEGGEKELYDIGTDPYELSNAYDPAAPPDDLTTRLQALTTCAGDSCRAAEDGP